MEPLTQSLRDCPPSEVTLVPVYIIRTRVAFATSEWVRFEGSQERMRIPDHDFKAGDKVEIRIRHAP